MGTEPRRATPCLTRRRLMAALGGSAALGAGSALAACQQGGQSAVSPTPIPRRPSPYAVRLQVWGDAREAGTYATIAREYSAAQPDISLETSPAPGDGKDRAGYFASFEAQVAAGDAADLVTFPGWMWQGYVGQGALQALDEFAERDNWSAPWPNNEAYALQTTFRGKRFLSTASANPHVIFYAKERFVQAGAPYPRPDWSFLDFQDLCRRLTQEAASGGRLFAYQWNAGYLFNAPWWRMQSQLEWDRIGEPRKAHWNSAAVVEAYQFQLYDSQYRLRISPTYAMLRDDPAPYAIEHGGVAMKMEGASFLSRMWGPRAARPKGTPFDVQVLPRGRVSKTPHLNLLLGQVMTRSSKDKEAAWDALKWISGENGQRRIAESGRLCNTVDASRKLWLPLAKAQFGSVNLEAFLRAMELGTVHLVGEVSEAMLARDAGLDAALEEIRDGVTPPQHALDAAQPRVQRVLDAYWTLEGSRR